MASVGDQLTQPEAGWRRYDDSDSVFEYTGLWMLGTSTLYYKERGRYTTDTVSTVSFKFTGTRIRIIAYRYSNQSPNIVITIDGEDNSYSLVNTSETFMSLVFEKEGLSSGTHTVTIKNNASGTFNFDAVDVDETGEISGSPVNTTGKLCNKLHDMEIGDYIVWKYDATNNYQFGGITDRHILIPSSGVPFASMPSSYFMYFIKVDRGLLISDRVFYHTRSWDSLNSAKAIQGFPTTISGVSGVIRSLTGGVAYADENGNKSFKNVDHGCFPINNEYSKYIVNFPINKIKQGKTLNDVWNDLSVVTLTQDTIANGNFISNTGSPLNGMTSTVRVARYADQGQWGGFSTILTTVSHASYGLRPVFEWREV
ncbi:hypothetical protein J2Z32_003342 [Paenibacillus turicensis]|uniref:Uncharacterized protein n=1 Tax=Paenibacillus turicensis TaxID=160487 RepID=A0ABS4FVR2_9BACL|nr:hypothetical protein [Paenibacillus turicensis]MBP1906678.1 hypothetical protein [Paenibacillus turicensis]